MRNGLRRLTGMLPQGTLQVSVGLAVLGVASYVHLAIAGHTLPQAQMADLSVLWSIVYSVGLGLFYPVEQEVTRAAAGRRVTDLGVGPVLRRGFLLSAGLCGAVWAVMMITSPVLASRFFGGETILVLVTALSIGAIALYSPVRGVTAGTGRFDLYGRQLGVDGGLRILLAALLGVVGWRSSALFGIILTIAPLVATVAVAGPVRRGATAGPRVTSHEFGNGVAPLMVSMLLGQVALNAAVVGARLLAPQQTALAAALLSALILIRIPVFVFSAIQASLLSGLAAAAARGETGTLRRMVRHACTIVTLLMVGAGIPAILAGPWLIHTLFAAPQVLSWLDFAILSLGTMAYLLSLVLGQATISLHRHRDQMVAWIGGALVLAAVMAVPGDVRLRVEWAYAVGTWVVVGVLAIALIRHRDAAPSRPEPATSDIVLD